MESNQEMRLENIPEGYGDFHNFQKRTHPSQDGKWIIKPRCLFWEWIFTDKESPIKDFFDFKTKGGQPFADFFFQQSVVIDSWSDCSGQVKLLSSNRADNSGTADEFAALLSYACVFGLADLHKDNILITKSGALPIDLEFIFVPFKSLEELQIFAQSEPQFAAIRCFEKLDSQQVITQFLNYTEKLIKIRNEVIDVILGFGGMDVPIRISFHNTSSYYDYLNDPKLNLSLIPEELSQLERRDIPYFFYTLAEGLVRYQSTPSGNLDLVRSGGRPRRALKKNFLQVFKSKNFVNSQINYSLRDLNHFLTNSEKQKGYISPG